MKKPLNPFLISGYQGASYFCDRKKETQSIVSALENGRNITLLSLRRMGKTGLIKHAFEQIKFKKFNLIYVDLLHTTDQTTMVREFAKATINQMSLGVMKASLQKIAQLFSSIRPTFTVDPLSGTPSVEIDIQKGKQGVKTLEEVFGLLEEHPTRVIVAFDEFQIITSYPEKNTEALLRGHIQHLNNVHFIFSGSQKHVLSNMFADARRPFYQSTQFLGLESISSKEYHTFIHTHFKHAGIALEKADIEFILDWTHHHTFYVQYFCNRLFDIKMTNTKSSVYHAIEKIFEENESIFTNYRSLLTPQQAQLLTSVAKEGWVHQPTSKDFLSKYRLTSSAVQRTLPALLQKEFLTKEKEGYRVYDVFLGRWLAEKY
jgi:uncharacterized protein